MAVKDFLNILPSNLTSDVNSNNYKFFSALSKWYDSRYLNFKQNIFDLVRTAVPGNDNKLLDKIGERYGVRRGDFNNKDFANFIRLYSLVEDWRFGRAWRRVLDLFIEFGWITDGGMSYKYSLGTRLTGDRKLEGDEVLIGGETTASGSFAPRETIQNKLIFSMAGVVESKKSLIKTFIDSRIPFFAEFKINYE